MKFTSADSRDRAVAGRKNRLRALSRVSAVAITWGVISGTQLVASAADLPPSDELAEVVVSARRQSESAMKIPESITVFDSSTLDKIGVESFNDYATKVSNLSFQFGGSGGGSGAALGVGGARAVAIRGISGAGTTGFYIDDTPVPATIDPQVVDINRIEVLKGPMGTLYGAGSMGGNIRMITNAPNFERELKYSIQGGYTEHASSLDGRFVVVGNTPLSDSVAVRVMGFVNHDGGFITRTFPTGTGSQYGTLNNQGAVTSYGGSATALIKLGDAVTITPRIIAQNADSYGWPVAYAPLPAFAVTSLTQARVANVGESYYDKWYLPSLQAEYAGNSWDVTFSSSYFNRWLSNVEDGTEGTTTVLTGPPYNAPASVFANGVAWPQLQTNSNVYQELRAAWKGTEYMHAIVGAYYANQIQKWENGSLDFTFPGLVSTGTWNTPLLWDQHINTGTLERALYTETYFKTGGFELTLGARKFWFVENFVNTTNGFVNYAPYTANPQQQNTENGTTPKVSLSYTTPGGQLVYATASKGYRAGGPNNPVTPACDLASLGITADQIKNYHSDSLWNYELGAKGHIGSFGLSAAVFQMNWSQVQQSVSLPVCFLPITANAGAARVRGGEIEAIGRLTKDLDLRVAVGYQDPRVTELGLTGQPVGSRLYQVPFVTGSAVLTYTRPLYTAHDGFATVDYSYTGDSLSSTTTQLYGQPPADRAGYSILNTRFGMRWSNKELGFFVKNVTDSRANLGDENPLAYPKVEANGMVDPRIVVLRPRQFGIEFKVGL